MKTKATFIMLWAFLLFTLNVFAQAPQKFNYQAVVRDNSGNILEVQTVSIKISILQESVTGTVVYSETHSPTTNAYGLVTLEIGGGTTSDDFSTIDWGADIYFLKVEMDPGTGYQEMGTTQLLSVPYALFADKTADKDDADADPANEIQDLSLTGNILTITGNLSPTDIDLSTYLDNTDSWVQNGEAIFFNGDIGIGTDSPGGKLEVVGDGSEAPDDPLFEVKRNDGQTVFAVYPEGVRIYVEEESAKGTKGGFAVGGFSPLKGVTNEFLRVTSDSIRMYVNDDGLKGTKGGFAVGGFSPVKGFTNEYLRVSPDSVRVYVEGETGKGTKGGFAIGGIKPIKGIDEEYLRITPDSVRVYINDNPSIKGTKGGFAVGGFTPAKGFTGDYLNVSGKSNAEFIDPSEARILWYPNKEAFLVGRVLIESPDSVGTNSLATGFESKAIGGWSQALGYKAIARKNYSTAIGKNAVTDGENSFAFGNQTIAHGNDAVAIGSGAYALADNSFAFGSIGINEEGELTGNTIAEGLYSYAFGLGCMSKNKAAFAMGANDTASGVFSLAMGYSTVASGDFSTAIGRNARASGVESIAIGSSSAALENMTNAFGMLDTASAPYATAMGHSCKASGWYSTALGFHAKAEGETSISLGGHTVAVGLRSTAIGYSTTANGLYATAIGSGTIANGIYSTAMGLYSTTNGSVSVAIGENTVASGDNSFALGSCASTNNKTGTFIYGDHSTMDTVYATANNQFMVRANGGAIFYSSSSLSSGVELIAGGGSWSVLSDRDKKMNFADIDKEEILTKLTRINIQSWSYKTQDPEIRHIGITSQDFRTNFGYGPSEKMITTSDLTGVNMVAIQGLIDRTDQLNCQVAEQQRMIEELKQEVEKLKNR